MAAFLHCPSLKIVLVSDEKCDDIRDDIEECSWLEACIKCQNLLPKYLLNA